MVPIGNNAISLWQLAGDDLLREADVNFAQALR